MRISKQEKALLQETFTAPEPKKKREFLRTVPKQEVTLRALILFQAAYIRKMVWAVSFLLFGLVVVLAQHIEMECIWVLAAVMPFEAMLIMMEFARSSAYGMTELEMTSRFSFRSLLLARMCIIGAVQMLGLFLVVPVLGLQLFKYGVYILVPYLLTSVLGLLAVRRMRGREGMYVCGSISAFIGGLCPLSRHFWPMAYEAESIGLWVLAAVLLLVCFWKEYEKTMNDLEELAWN